MPDFPYTIHIPTQLEALSSGFQRVGQAAKVAVDQIVDAFTAVMADEAGQRRRRGPSIGRKRRTRRARGRGQADA
jgi:hypothetical protein